MIAFFKVCKAVMIQGFTENLSCAISCLLGEYSSITRPLLAVELTDTFRDGKNLLTWTALSFVSLTISHSLQVFIALFEKLQLGRKQDRTHFFILAPTAAGKSSLLELFITFQNYRQ